MNLLSLLSTNKRRRHRRTTKGNFAFRRKKPARTEVHRIDLNPETDASRRAAFRKRAGLGARWAFGLIAGIVCLALIKVVAMEAFVDNAKFRLQHIEVVSDAGPLSRSALAGASGLKVGENLLMISLRAVRDRLESLPEVRDARVSRHFPGMIVLEISQRTPVAWMECPEKSIAAKVSGYGCLLDAEGVVLPSMTHVARDQRLPVVRVEKLPRVIPGRRVESTAALSALHLLQMHGRGPLAERIRIHRIDATRPHALEAHADGGLKVTFPAEGDFARELTRLQQVLERSATRGWQVASVNLLVAHNVPVTLRRGSEPAAAPASGRTLARNR